MKKPLKFGAVLAAVLGGFMIVSCASTTADSGNVSEGGLLTDISEKRSKYDGIVIGIDSKKIPSSAKSRTIFVSHNGEAYDRDVSYYAFGDYRDSMTNPKEWGYPFVEPGVNYVITVCYYDFLKENFSRFYIHSYLYKVSGDNKVWLDATNDDNTIKTKDMAPNDFYSYKEWDYKSTDKLKIEWTVFMQDSKNKYGEYSIKCGSGSEFSITSE